MAENIDWWPEVLTDSRNVLADVDAELTDVGQKEIKDFDWSAYEKTWAHKRRMYCNNEPKLKRDTPVPELVLFQLWRVGTGPCMKACMCVSDWKIAENRRPWWL